jgi:hypothetical protein
MNGIFSKQKNDKPTNQDIVLDMMKSCRDNFGNKIKDWYNK